MPCRSDYMESNEYEQRLQETAQLLVFVKTELGLNISKRLLDASENIYCKADYVPELCKTIRAMDETQLNQIVYNARRKQSRALADWWDEHQEADRIREEAEANERKRKALRKVALAKLTKEERQALDL